MLSDKNTRGSSQSPELSNDAAGKLLVNIFEACDMEPSNLSIEALSSYTEYRREKHGLEKIILLFIFVVFLVLPLFFIAPELNIRYTDRISGYPVYSLSIDSSIIPVSRVSASLDGKAVSVYESGTREFKITPTENGQLTVRVTLANRQYNLVTVQIEGIDVDSPRFVSSSKVDDILYIYFSETGSGVDEDGCYAVSVSGAVIYPLSVDPVSQCVAFDFPEENMTIFIPDKKGNTMQLLFSVP